MSRSHRARKGDGWPKGPRPLSATAIKAVTQPTHPDVCPQHVRCGHVVCSIVWFCMEATS